MDRVREDGLLAIVPMTMEDRVMSTMSIWKSGSLFLEGMLILVMLMGWETLSSTGSF